MKSEKIVKGRRRAWVHWTFLTVFLIGIPSFVHADINDFLLKFNPYMTAQETYSNNILLTKTNQLDDFITTVYPGLGFSDIGPGTYGINLDFIAGYTYYAVHRDYSYFSPAGNLDAWYAITSNLTFRARDYLVRSDAAKEQLGETSDTSSLDQLTLSTIRATHAIYVRNVVEPSVEYHFGGEDLLSVLYRNNIYHNYNPLFESSQENTIDPRLNYWFDVRNGVTLEYILTSGTYSRYLLDTGTYSHDPNQLEQAARARYTYRFDPRTSIFGEYYFEWQIFDSPGVDYHVHNPSLGIQYKFSPTLTGTVQGGYYWFDAADGSTSNGPTWNLSLSQRAERTTYTVLLQGGYTEDYFTAQNLGFVKYYDAYGTITHRLTDRLTVGATGSVERPTYQTGQRDLIWLARGGISYSLSRWLSISLEGSYTRDQSTTPEFSYTEYRVMVGITLGNPAFRGTIMGQPTFLQRITR